MQSANGYAYDMCSNGQCPHIYSHRLPPLARRGRMGERCPVCGTNRYLKRNHVIEPVRRCELADAYVQYCLILGSDI